MWCAIYLLLLLITGCCVASCISKQLPRLELLGLGACLGPAVVGGCMLALSFLGLRPTRMEIFLPTFAAVAGAIITRIKTKIVPSPVQPKTAPSSQIWIGLCLLVIGYGLTVVAIEALVHPTLE